MTTPDSRQTHIDAQEETVIALWEFAREVIALGDAQSFDSPPGAVEIKHTTPQQRAAIGAALERIVTAYGFRVVEVQ